MLLMLSGWRFACDHLHLHRSRQEQLLLLLLLLRLLGLLSLVLDRVGTLVGRSWLRHHVVLHSLWRSIRHLVVGNACCGTLWLLLVVLIEFLNVQTAAALVHMDLCVHGALDLNRLCPVPLLSVQLAAIHRINMHHFTALMILASRSVGCRDNGLASRIVAKVRLVHQLFVEG